MLPDIQLDSKRRQELVALLRLHLQLLKLRRLKLETARRTTKKLFRRFSQRLINHERKTRAEFHRKVEKLRNSGPEYFRVSREHLDEILMTIRPKISHRSTQRVPIGPEERLSITFRLGNTYALYYKSF